MALLIQDSDFGKGQNVCVCVCVCVGGGGGAWPEEEEGGGGDDNDEVVQAGNGAPNGFSTHKRISPRPYIETTFWIFAEPHYRSTKTVSSNDNNQNTADDTSTAIERIQTTAADYE